MPAKSDKSSKKEVGILAKSYLLAYNVAQVAGWSYLLYQMILYYTNPSPEQSLWETVKWTVIVFQNAAILEVIHALTGLVSSNAMVTLFQVASRVMLVCGVLISVPAAAASFGLHMMLLAWTITEIIRYSFYAVGILGLNPFILVWCRYTFFIALYPIGVTGELLCLFAGQALVAETKQWSVEMPNSWNVTFSYRYFLIVVMLMYIPLFPDLYLHMFRQRSKILGEPKKTK
ncbi:hypothetical protein B566_EDAN016201 [Ephemera danica]|nr:hypothetical protein B566_EDAN016201 [Ephemera danica]